MTKTYHGSCICGSIKFEADLDLSKGTGKCNCTICRKLRFWGAKCKPAQFRLIPNNTPEAEAELTTDYIFKSPMVHQIFCKKCGTHAYHRGDIPQVGGEFVSVSIACLDDVDEAGMSALDVRHADGRNDNWWNEPKDKTYL